MITLRLAVPAVLTAAAVAACVTYFVSPPAQVKADQRSQPTLPNLTIPHTRAATMIDPPASEEEEKAAAAFRGRRRGDPEASTEHAGVRHYR